MRAGWICAREIYAVKLTRALKGSCWKVICEDGRIRPTRHLKRSGGEVYRIDFFANYRKKLRSQNGCEEGQECALNSMLNLCCRSRRMAVHWRSKVRQPVQPARRTPSPLRGSEICIGSTSHLGVMRPDLKFIRPAHGPTFGVLTERSINGMWLFQCQVGDRQLIDRSIIAPDHAAR